VNPLIPESGNPSTLKQGYSIKLSVVLCARHKPSSARSRARHKPSSARSRGRQTLSSARYKKLSHYVGIQFHLEADESQIPLWCDTYAEQLAGEGKCKHEVFDSYKNKAEQTREMSFKLLDNFFSLE